MSFSNLKSLAAIVLGSFIATTSFAALVDTTGAAVTNETALGDIDMAASKMGDLSEYMATGIVADATNTLSTDLKLFVTNTIVVGYTDWSYTGDTSSSATYSITMTEHQGGGGLYDFTLYDPSQVGVVTTNELNPTMLVFTFNTTMEITASREEIRRDANGRALYSDVQRLRTYVDDMDTSYQRYNGITNKNQSVQYICTDANTTELEILMPDSGITKDWLVYILPMTNLNIVLPPANYWVANESVTNAVPSDTPTALYFTQIDNNTFSIGRKEFIPITVLSARERALEKAKAKVRKRGLRK